MLLEGVPPAALMGAAGIAVGSGWLAWIVLVPLAFVVAAIRAAMSEVRKALTPLRVAVGLVVAAAFVTTLPSTAHAGDATLAESLFREGRALMESGQYAEACPKLEESYKQDPATGTLLALAVCQEKSGMTASAWTSFGEAAARAKREGSAEREQAARQSQAALEPKLSRLTVTVSDAVGSIDGLVVKRDGEEMGHAAWGSAAAIDPGEHTIEASAPGKEAWKTTIVVGVNADKQVVEVPVLNDAAHPQPALAASPSSKDETVAPPSGPPTLTWVAFGVGGGGLTIGVVAGLVAGGKHSTLEGECDGNTNTCEPPYADDLDAFHTWRTVSTVGYVVGALGVAGGAVLWLTTPSESSTAAVRAWVGPTSAGVAGRF